MAEADWDEVSHLRKKPMRAAEARSHKVSRLPVDALVGHLEL